MLGRYEGGRGNGEEKNKTRLFEKCHSNAYFFVC